jgi:hypothetical protein
MTPKKPAPDLIRGGNRFSGRIMLKTKNLGRNPIQLTIQLTWITVWSAMALG